MIVRYSAIRTYEEVKKLPPEVVHAFTEIGLAQRGAAEKVMKQIQVLTGGGVLNPVVEHAGDLIHRMTHMLGWGDNLARSGYEYVSTKVRRVLDSLEDPYGFEKELQENIRGYAEYLEIPQEELEQKIVDKLSLYAKEHAALKSYNKAHSLAKRVCVSIGNRDFKSAIRALHSLQESLGDAKTWDTFATQYTLTPEGLEEYADS